MGQSTAQMGYGAGGKHKACGPNAASTLFYLAQHLVSTLVSTRQRRAPCP